MVTRRPSGLTLIELLVTLGLIVVLLTIAVAGLEFFFRRSRLDAAASNFMTTLNFARSEAIRTGVTVSVCKSRNGTSCGDSGVNWEDGWIVFANLDDDSPVVVDVNEPILRVGPPLAKGVSLRPNVNFSRFLSYRPDGRANNIGTFAICYNNRLAGAKSITIIGTGRARFGIDTNDDDIPEKEEDGRSVNIESCTNP